MNNIINNLGYTGIVKLSIQCTKTKKIKSTKIIKNNGTVDLFKFLCNCLIQRYTATNAPRYLGASINQVTYQENSVSNLNNINSALSYKSKLSNTQLINKPIETSKVNVSGYNWHAVFNGIILFGQLKDSTRPIRSLQLYSTQGSQDLSTPLVYINLDDDQIVTLTSGEALLVEWDMSFNNWSLRPTILNEP